MVFFGEFQLSFTGVGRIVLPKKIRELLKGNTFIVTKGFDFCLACYDKTEWEIKAHELINVSLLDKENIEKRRFVFSSAVYIEIDDQGRFVLPRTMLDYSGLGKKACIIGTGDHFEIWEPEKWREYTEKIKH